MSDQRSKMFQEHKDLIQLVYAYDYYISVFERTEELFPIEFSSDDGIRTFWNDFMCMLPDTPAIQRDPYNRICDMAEGKY